MTPPLAQVLERAPATIGEPGPGRPGRPGRPGWPPGWFRHGDRVRAVFVATFNAAVRIARVPRPVWWTMLVAASPVVALPLAVGDDDLPVLGLMCLGLALASRGSRRQWRWAAAAGLALGWPRP